jgi:hypothetical protein
MNNASHCDYAIKAKKLEWGLSKQIIFRNKHVFTEHAKVTLIQNYIRIERLQNSTACKPHLSHFLGYHSINTEDHYIYKFKWLITLLWKIIHDPCRKF